MIYKGTVRTPHDGDYVDPEITWDRINGRYIININGYIVAYLDKETHRLWLWNPELYERIKQQIHTETLVH